MRFGRLIVVEKAEAHVSKSGLKKGQWICKCDCGNIIKVITNNLTSGNSKSCGCLNLENVISRNTTHGERYSRLYKVWENIKSRCYLKSNSRYKNYGGRGISVCDEWKNSFEKFSEWAYANGYDGSAEFGECTIDRIDVDGNYCPENCRFVNIKSQANNRTNTYYITIDGETHSLSEWSDITGIKYHTIFARINKLNWEPKKALELI